MMKKLGLGLLVSFACAACSGSDGKDGATGTEGATGPQGEQGETGAGGAGTAADGSISGVFPASAFLGGTDIEVTVSGYATSWDDTTTLDFGEGVTVKSIQVASPTALVAVIDVTSTATMGKRDVSVTTGSDSLSYTLGFGLASPIVVETLGTVAQGSVVFATIRNQDTQNPFDDTSTGDGLFSPLVFTNVAITAPNGVNAQVTAVSPYSVEATLLIDADAATGALALNVESGPTGNIAIFSNPEALDVAARTPTAIMAGTPVAITVDDPLQSDLFTFDAASGLNIVTMSVAANTGSPGVFLLGTSGSFVDLSGGDPTAGFATSAAGSWYAMTLDTSGESGYSSTLSLDTLAATGASEGTNNDAAVDADAIVVPAVLQGAGFSSETDADWFSFDVAAGDVGKTIVVATYGADAQTDTIIEVYAPDGTTLLGDSGDDNFHESLTSDPIAAAGTHYVRIYASSFYDAAHTSYDAYMYVD